MSLADQYACALLPDRWRVLGVRLQPLTVGHGIVLARLHSPFTPFSCRPSAHLGDLLLALFACGRPWARGWAALGSRKASLFLRLWAWQILRRAESDSIIGSAADAFGAYVHAHCAGPRVWEKDGAGASAANSPVLCTLKIGLQEHFGRSEAEALDTLISAALWELYCYAEQHGGLQLVSDTELAALPRRN